MSIKKEANKQWEELNERVFDALADDKEFTPRSLWDSATEGDEGVEYVASATSLTEKQAEIWLTKGKPRREYTLQEQTEAVVLFKALLLYNALIQEAKMTGAKDLLKSLNNLKDAIITLERQEDAFESLKEMFFWDLEDQNKRGLKLNCVMLRVFLTTQKK
jgi:hypothetical protein